jgi:hypothetical protein
MKMREFERKDAQWVENDDGQEDHTGQKARPGPGCGKTGLRGPLRGEENGKVESQGEARSEEGGAKPQKGGTRAVGFARGKAPAAAARASRIRRPKESMPWDAFDKRRLLMMFP